MLKRRTYVKCCPNVLYTPEKANYKAKNVLYPLHCSPTPFFQSVVILSQICYKVPKSIISKLSRVKQLLHR